MNYSDEDYQKIINFFASIHDIVSRQNHTLKFDSSKQIVDIVNLAAEREGFKLRFIQESGFWIVDDYEDVKHELDNLDRIQYRFSRIYRHNALDYARSKKGE